MNANDRLVTLVAMALVLAVATPAAGVVAAGESHDLSPTTVSMAENGTTNESADNSTDDGNETADGNESVDGNQTVGNGTDGNWTHGEFRNFGQFLRAFVHGMLSAGGDPGGGTVAVFVLEHNPGNPPDHAGPPERGDGNGTETNGTAENDTRAGPPGNGHGGGPPDGHGPPWAGPGEDSGNGTAGDHPGGGPPPWAGADEE